MRRRLFLSYILLFISVTVAVTFFCINAGQNFYIKQLKNELINDCRIIARSIAQEMDLQSYINEMGNIIQKRVTIIDNNGLVTAESYTDKDIMDNHINRIEIQEAIKNKVGFSTRKSITTGTEWLYCAIKVDTKEFTGFVRCAIPLDQINEIINTYIRYGVIGVLIGIIIGSIIAYIFSKRLSEPIDILTEAADKISEGKLDINVNINEDPKFKILADAFNNMSSRLKESLTKLENKNVELESIMNSMLNGLIAVDTKNRVFMTNKVLYKHINLHTENIIGYLIEEKIRVIDIIEAIDKVKKTHKIIEKEFKLYDGNKERILTIKASPIFDYDNKDNIIGVLIITQDITTFRKLEKIRSEFVSNVSHELKTPLTSIKGFVEILTSDEELDNDTKNKFLDIINIETERLYSLIQDLLTLSEIENEKNPDFEYFDFKKLIEEVVIIMTPSAKKKNIEVKVDIQEGFPKIFGIPDRIKQMVINLIDNGVKYTDKGEVTIKCSYTEDKWVLSVKDTGIGIPEESIPRLFERFYREDKGRSRKMGGTGLGLSIVKHIVRLHSGKINVYSKIGEGSEFIVTFPIKRALS
jgi:two-component system phosphate regulon sensor histidine kinase PhoR